MTDNAPASAAAPPALTKQQVGDPPWLIEALRLNGMKEVAGSKHNPEVVKLFAEVGHAGVQDDETAWCAAFVGAMLGRGGYAGTGKLNARSYLDYGTTPAKPQRGDIVVFPRGGSEWQGHVAFVAKVDDQYVYAFGGNQANSVNVTRFSRGKVLGFRRPSQANQIGFDMLEQVQTALRNLGYTEVGASDGVMGPLTRAAIIRFERDHGLTPTGKASRELLAKLLASANKAQPTASPTIQTATPAAKPTLAPANTDQPTQSPQRGIAGWLILAAVVVAALVYVIGFVRF